MREKFSIGNVSSDNYGMVLTEILTWETPEINVKFEPIPGRNDTLTTWDGRLKNLEFSYFAYINKDFFAQYSRFRNAILSHIGYQKISDSTDPDHYRFGIVHQSIHGKPSERGASGTVEIRITCKPQRFLISGEQKISLSAPGSLMNPTAFVSKPLIKVYGTGTGELHAGGRTVRFTKPIDQHVILDCEMLDAYRLDGSGAPENKNETIFAPEFPMLSPGTNQISWTGDISKVEIIPRWWTI